MTTALTAAIASARCLRAVWSSALSGTSKLLVASRVSQRNASSLDTPGCNLIRRC